MARYGRDFGGYGGWGSHPGYPRDGSEYGAPGYAGPRGYGGGAGRYDRGWYESPRGRGGWGGWATGRGWGGESDADRIRAADIMTENPEAVTPDTTLSEVAKRMRDLDVGLVPVVDNEEDFRLRGVITDRDIAVRAAAEGKDMQKARVSEYMTPGVETVGESDHVRDVFAVMKRARVRRVPVTDREGRLVGIIAQADLAVSYAGIDLQRETEVEEVIERISEPGHSRQARRPGMEAGPRRGGGGAGRGYDGDLGDRLRAGWRTLREEARHLMPGYRRRWW